MNNEEIWKPVKGYEGLYEVSNLGRVWSNISNKFLKGCIGNGYVMYGLTKNGKTKTVLLHRLIANAFIPKEEGKDCIDHINGIRNDNRIENLRWCTKEENNKYPLAGKHRSEGLKGKYLGKDANNCVGVIQLSLNGEFIKEWYCLSDVEREMGIKASNLSRCCRGKCKTLRGCKWVYKKDWEVC